MDQYPQCVTKFYEHSQTFHVDHVTPESWANIDIPQNTKRLVISGDFLDELVIPNGVVSCICHGMGLRKLTVPDTVEYLFCNRNQLRSLELPHAMYMCDISHNPLYHLRFRKDENDTELCLGRIQMNHVKMSSFDAKVKENCEIDMSDNPQLVAYSPEVEYAAFTYPYRGREYVDDHRY